MPEEYMERVKNVHEKGGYGSRGYQNNWDIKEAKKNLIHDLQKNKNDTR